MKGDWRKILGVPEKTSIGDVPDCTNCGAECESERKPGWICGSWKEKDVYQIAMKMEGEYENRKS